MYDKNVVRRRRAALAICLGASLLLLTLYFGESAGGGLHAVQRGAQEALAPVETGVSKAVKPFRDLAGWTGDVLSAKGENKDLKNEVSRLRRDLARSQTEQRDVAQLGSLEAIHRKETFPQGVNPVTARVIARSPTVWYSSIQVNKGSGDGLAVNQPAITGDGLVGKVTSVTSGTARVTLITDASSAVSAQVVPDGASGIVKPEVGQPDDLLLEFIQKGRRVTKGATLVTSGFRSSKLESLFPRGIPVGKVTKVDSDEIDLYQRVHIQPFADLRRVDYVQVLTSTPDTARAQTGAP